MIIWRMPNFGPQVVLHDVSVNEIVNIDSTHKYAGAAQQSRLKNKIVRQESRSPKPKTTGPSVPAENL